ncbi:helix-turn-helix psq domain [Holotrichia oblita]|uniref:Helix-turn-helix psq domain n=1 Tax=Holotrichia oblita TaxID=644536 RepID=A0ACB9TIL9_HOLOL|nr:helix-turn-helix psq domain [Holotrichia oblita]
MPRNKFGVKRPHSCADDMKKAATRVLAGSLSITQAAKSFNLSKSVLARHLNAKRANSLFDFKTRLGHKQILTKEEEDSLEQYLKTSAKLDYGLTTLQLRKLAYQYAVANKKKVPNWEENGIATKGWLRDVQKHHQSLRLRRPEVI